MGFWSRFKDRRKKAIERQRTEATLKAAGLGATPDEARRAGDQAALGTKNAAIFGSIPS